MTGPDICGRVAPWGPACPLAAGHHEAHDWRYAITRGPLTETGLKVVLWLTMHPRATAREVARFLWPDSPAWHRRTKKRLGRNGAMGGTMPMKAGRLLAGLADGGHVERTDDYRWVVR